MKRFAQIFAIVMGILSMLYLLVYTLLLVIGTFDCFPQTVKGVDPVSIEYVCSEEFKGGSE